MEQIWKHYHDWPKMKPMLSRGCKYPLIPDIDEPTRLQNIRHQIERGNHPYANLLEKTAIVLNNYDNEVKLGFMIPILISALTKIQFLNLIPIGNAVQPTLDPLGNKITKKKNNS